MAKKLSEIIQVDNRFTRAASLERDFLNLDALRTYIVTRTGISILKRIIDAFPPRPSQRAFTLTGPYGSGKSAFGVFLAALLSGHPPISSEARRLLAREEEFLAKAFRKAERVKAFMPILLTGTYNSLAGSLIQSAAKAADGYWAGKGRNPDVCQSLKLLAEKVRADCIPSNDRVIEAIDQLTGAVARISGAGLIIIVDELGRFLEFSSRANSDVDLYLLQLLAEYANKTTKTPVFLIGILHQAFEQYATSLNQRRRESWAKVQGRFEDIAFRATEDEALLLISRALCHTTSKHDEVKLNKWAKRQTEIVVKLNLTPKGLTPQKLVNIFNHTYPLHPLVVLTLPALTRQYAQNERTLFSFLASKEDGGLASFLASVSFSKDELPVFEFWHLYDYFLSAHHGSIAGHVAFRRWVEVSIALDRLGNDDEVQTHLVKTIGLLNILGPKGNLRASEGVIRFATGLSKSNFDSLIKKLLKCKCITERKHAGEFRVWQGSDFDFDEQIRIQRESALGSLDFVQAIEKEFPATPVIAKRHSFASGTLRLFSSHYVNGETLRSIAEISRGSTGSVLLSIPTSEAEYVEMVSFAKKVTEPCVILAIAQPVAHLIGIIQEVYALRRIEKEAAALQGDPVAQRELRERLHLLENSMRDEINALFDGTNPKTIWYWKGNQQTVKSRRDLTAIISMACDEIYYQTPRIWNELINRDTISSTVASARLRLLDLMITSPEKERLGIEGNPPEYAIYASLFEVTGIHGCRGGTIWGFGRPSEEADSGIKAMWNEIEDFLKKTQAAPQPITNLFKRLKAAPYGMKEGVIPLFIAAAYLYYESEVGLFERQTFVPMVTSDVFERMLKVPDTFSIQFYPIEGNRAALFQRYAEIIQLKNDRRPEVLDIARPIIRFLLDLPEFSRKTKRVSAIAQGIRLAIAEARSPFTLLFEELPRACGYKGFSEEESDQKEINVEKYMGTLRTVFKELSQAYEELLRYIERILAESFYLSVYSNELRTLLRVRAKSLISYTLDPQLKAFLTRIIDEQLDHRGWIESIGTYLAAKPPATWDDTDLARMELTLADLGRRFRNLESLRIAMSNQAERVGKEHEAIRISITPADGVEAEEVVFFERGHLPQIETLEKEVEEKFKGCNVQIALTVLARLLGKRLALQEKSQDSEVKKGGIRLIK